ncbi:hypothetical protein MRX96_045506 [Rhipicephalus microplus]
MHLLLETWFELRIRNSSLAKGPQSTCSKLYQEYSSSQNITYTYTPACSIGNAISQRSVTAEVAPNLTHQYSLHPLLVQNLVVAGTKDESVLRILLSLEHLLLTDNTVNVQAYLPATYNMGKCVIRLANTFTTNYILANTISPNGTIIRARRFGSTNVVMLTFEHSNIPRLVFQNEVTLQAGQARNCSRTPSRDHKEQQESSNMAGHDTGARSSWPRSKKRAAFRSMSRSRPRERQSAQKHIEHDKTSTAPSTALK